MKINWNNKYLTISVYSLIVVALSIVIYKLLQGVSDYSAFFDSVIAIVKPIIYGIVLAYILSPIEKLFEYKLLPKVFKKRSKKLIRYLSIGIAYLLFVIAFSLVLYIAVPQLLESINRIIVSIPMYVVNVQNWFNSFMETKIGKLIGNNIDMSSVNFQSIFTNLQDMLNSSFIAVKSTLSAFVEMLFNIIVAVAISVYLLVDREIYFKQFRKLMYAFGNKDKVTNLCKECYTIKEIFNSFMYGKLIECLIVGIACYIGVVIMGVNNALLISVIVGITNFIPYFGPFLGAIPGVILIFFDGENGTNPTMTLVFIIFILVLQQLDGNVLGPRIQGKSVGLSSFWVLISVIVFGEFFGVWGMLLSAPVFAVLMSALKVIVNNRLKRNDIDPSSDFYHEKPE